MYRTSYFRFTPLLRQVLLGALFVAHGTALCTAQRVLVNAEPGIQQLFQAWTAQNRSNPRIEGWRVQIASSTDRQSIESIRAQFLSLYPNVPANWVHDPPYYKLRVGAFSTRQEALAFLLQVRYTYPHAYTTRDPNIHPRDFIR